MQSESFQMCFNPKKVGNIQYVAYHKKAQHGKKQANATCCCFCSNFPYERNDVSQTAINNQFVTSTSNWPYNFKKPCRNGVSWLKQGFATINISFLKNELLSIDETEMTIGNFGYMLFYFSKECAVVQKKSKLRRCPIATLYQTKFHLTNFSFMSDVKVGLQYGCMRT